RQGPRDPLQEATRARYDPGGLSLPLPRPSPCWRHPLRGGGHREEGPLPFVSGRVRLTAIEYLNQSALVAATSEVDADTDDHVTGLLTELARNLPPMLSGARAVLETKHPDFVRHFAASLRGLFTHFLHQLASDTALKAWSNSADNYHNGRPTRRSRLRYITR